MNRRRSAICLLAVLVAAPWSSVALAQRTTDAAAAETLFDQAKVLFDAGKFGEACPKFAESHELDPGVGVLLYLGDCYEKTGRLASAWAAYKEAIPAAKARRDAEREQIATDRAKAMEIRLPKLRVNVATTSRVPGLTLLRDGTPVREPTWGTALPVDAGPHVIEAAAPGRKPWKTTVTSSEGTLASVDVPALLEGDGAGPPAPAPNVPAEPGVTTDFWGPQRIASVVVGGLGLGGVVVGTVFGVQTIQDWDSAESHCTDGEPRACDAEGVRLASDVELQGIVSTVGVAVGIAALGTAVVLWFTAPDAAPVSGTEARLQPLFSGGPSSGFLGLGGSF